MNFSIIDKMDQRKKMILIVILSIVVSVTMAGILSVGMKELFRRNKYVYHDFVISDGDEHKVALYDGREYVQTVTVPFDRFKGFMIYFSNPNIADAKGKVIVTLSHDGDEIQTWTKKAEKIKNEVHRGFKIKQTYSCNEGDTFEISIKTDGVSKDLSLGIFRSDGDLCSEGSLFLNGEEKNYDLTIRVRGSFPAMLNLLFPVLLFLFLILSLILARGVFYRYWNGMTRLDEVIIFMIIAACCLLFSQYVDQLNASMGGIYFLKALQNGKVLDYYSYQYEVTEFGMIGNYNIVVYIAMAIIYLPYYILVKLGAFSLNAHVVVLYYNVFLCILFYFTGKIFAGVLKGYGADDVQAAYGRALFYLSPVLLFCTVGFVQQDLLYISVLLAGVRLYQKGHKDAAFLVMSVSVALKSLPLFIIVPFILLSEKNFWKDLRYVIELLLVSLIAGMLYSSNAGYQEVDHAMYYENLFVSSMTMSHWHVSLFLLLWFCFCCWCFYRKPVGGWKDLFVASLGGFTIFALFCGWNPQYLAGYGVVIVAWGLLTTDKNRYFVVTTVMGAVLIAFSCMQWGSNSDNWMCNYGLLYQLDAVKLRAQPVTLRTLLGYYSSLPTALISMAILSMLGAAIVFVLMRCISELKGKEKLAVVEKDQIFSILVYLPVVPLILYVMISYGLLLAH